MKKLIYIFLFAFAYHTSFSQSTTVYKDEFGRTIGTAEKETPGTTTYRDQYGRTIGTATTEPSTQYKPIGSGAAQVIEPMYNSNVMLKAIEIRNNREIYEAERTKTNKELAYTTAGLQAAQEGIKLLEDKKYKEALEKLKISEQLYLNTSYDIDVLYVHIAWCSFFTKDREGMLRYVHKVDHITNDDPVPLWQLCIMTYSTNQFDLFEKYMNRLYTMAQYDKNALKLFNALYHTVSKTY